MDGVLDYLAAVMDNLTAGSGARLMDLLLAAFLIGLIWSTVIADRSGGNGFKFVDILMENGKASKWSVIVVGSWLIHSWALIKWTVTGYVTTPDFVTYGGIWITPLIAKMFAPNGKDPLPPAPKEQKP